MDLARAIETANNGETLATLAAQAGLTREQATEIVRAALPEIAMNIERNTLSRGGLADLVAALGYGHHQRYLDEPAALTSPAGQADGDAILRHVFGSRDAADAAARRIARATGTHAEGVTAAMPALAALAMGAVARSTASRFGDIFAQMPEIGSRGGFGGGRTASGFPGQPSQSVPGGNIPRQQPLPVPDDIGPGGSWSGNERPRSPFDDLSDTIRRRGRTSGGAPAGSVVRDILGQVLGFQKGGVISWIIRFIVMRYGWRILTGLLFGRR